MKMKEDIHCQQPSNGLARKHAFSFSLFKVQVKDLTLIMKREILGLQQPPVYTWPKLDLGSRSNTGIETYTYMRRQLWHKHNIKQYVNHKNAWRNSWKNPLPSSLSYAMLFTVPRQQWVGLFQLFFRNAGCKNNVNEQDFYCANLRDWYNGL